MRIIEFISFLLEDSLEDAREQNQSPKGRLAFQGAEQGIVECRARMQDTCMVQGLRGLLDEAQADTKRTVNRLDHGFWVAREKQIEAITGAISVALLLISRPVIQTPSKQAVLVAAKLLGATDLI